MEFSKKLSKSIITTFKFTKNIGRNFKTMFNEHILNVMHIMEIHDKPPHLLRHFGFSIMHIVYSFRYLFTKNMNISCYLIEIFF